MTVIDLFAGCGGLSVGFQKAGFLVTKAVEFDSTIAETYKRNHPNVEVIVDDIKNVDNSKVFKNKEADVIIGGPPCQGFSMAGARIRNGFIDDPRNYLFKHYFNVVRTVKPKVFVFENVKGIQTMQNGTIFNEILQLFANKDLLDGDFYDVHYEVFKAKEYGIPQKRERMIIIGVLNQKVLWQKKMEEAKERVLNSYPSFFNLVTVWDALSNLNEPTNDGRVINKAPENDYQSFLACNKEVLDNHCKTHHSIIAISRMHKVKNGENYTVLDEPIHSVHSGSYGRLDWEEQAPTITTRFDTPAGGRFIHPTEDRTLTPREAARIQSFPDDFVFLGGRSSICKQIGNAVPPKISYFIAQLVNCIIEKEN